MNKDPLDKFIIDEAETLDKELLANLMDSSFKLTKGGEFVFYKQFYKKPGWEKILRFLVGRKIILTKKLKKDFKEEIKPKEISETLGIPKKTVTKFLSNELKGLTKSEKGAHKIPNYNLHKCEEILKKNVKANS